jgi:hypothetical protein
MEKVVRPVSPFEKMRLSGSQDHNRLLLSSSAEKYGKRDKGGKSINNSKMMTIQDLEGGAHRDSASVSLLIKKQQQQITQRTTDYQNNPSEPQFL